MIGTNTNVRTEPAPLTPAPPAPVPRPSDIGVKTFDEINASMAEVTGVSANTQKVKDDLHDREAAAASGGRHQGVPGLAPGGNRADGDRLLQRPGR